MRKKIILLLTCFASISSATSAQTAHLPVIGKPFPDIVFHNVKNYKQQDFAVKDQRGKWLIIDFWSLRCTSCFSLFRRVKELEQAHAGKIQFLQIGKKDRTYCANVEPIYERISENMKLRVPAAFDTTWREKFGIETYPHIYIIDPDGILRFITDGRDLTVDKVAALLKKQEVTFYPKDAIYKTFDVSFLSDSDHVQAASLISASADEAPGMNFDIFAVDDLPPETRQKGWIAPRMTLNDLYNIAYFGKESWSRYDTGRYAKIFPYPLLQMQDTSLFSVDYTVSPLTGVYNCFIKLPLATANAETYRRALRDALKSAFGYNVSIETREVPVWALVAKPGVAERLRTRGGAPNQQKSSTAGGFVLRNHTVRELIGFLTSLRQDYRAIFVDATGIDTNIDFSIESDMTDFALVQKELSRQGLSFVKQKKLMKVLVLKD